MAYLDDSWFADPAVMAVHRWLQSDDGQRAVQRTLRQRRLPPAFDADLEHLVVRSAARAIERGKSIDMPPAWATACLRRRSIDLMRSPGSRRVTAAVGDAPDAMDSIDRAMTADGEYSGEEVVDAQMAADDLRRRVLAFGGTPWVASAALTHIAVALDQATPGAGCPEPVAGAGQYEAALWAGLWYADQRSCFDDESDATRKRRSRSCARVKDLLAQVGEAAGLREAHHG